jgi:hypothetical protein
MQIVRGCGLRRPALPLPHAPSDCYPGPVLKRLELLLLIPGAVLFALLLRRYGVASLRDALAGQGPRFFLILIPTAAAQFLFGYAWWLTLNPDDRRSLRFGSLLLTSVAGFSLNAMTPFLALGGEPYKMAVLSRRLGRSRAAGSVLAFNALHVLSRLFIFVAGCGLGFRLLSPSPVRIAALGASALVSIFLAGVLLTCHERGVAAWLFRLLDRLKLRRGSARERRQQQLQEVEESVRAFYRSRRRDFWTALAADFAGRAVWTCELTFMLRNAGRWLSPARSFFLHTINGIMMVPACVVPYELGVKEGAFCLGLRWLGLDPSLGIYVGVASRLREIFWIAAGMLILAALGARRAGSARLEEDVDDVAVAHHVVPPFGAHEPVAMQLRAAPVMKEILVREDLHPDEPVLHVGVDPTGRRGGGGSFRHEPRAQLVVGDSVEGDQAEQAAAALDQEA